jgi:hypothetical protein
VDVASSPHSKILPGLREKLRKRFTDGNSDGFRGQSEDKEVAILINYRSIVRRNAEQVRSV